MRILAVDPGPIESAFLVWNGEAIASMGQLENHALKSNFVDHACDCDLLAIETIQCFGMPAGAEMFNTMFWVGRFCEAWPLPFELVKRSDVKMHLCGSMKAKDSNIRRALIDHFGKPGTKKAPGLLYGVSNHLWSALAIAVTVADRKQIASADANAVARVGCF